MRSERDEIVQRGEATVMVWTPWGEQRVPRATGNSASLRRLLKRARDKDGHEFGVEPALN